VVGTSGAYPPFSSFEGGRAVGFAPELLEAFADRAGVDRAWVPFRWSELGAAMREGRYDVVADGITVRPERSIAGVFTVPIARGGAVLLVRRPAWAPPEGGVPPRDALRALDRRDLRVVVNQGGHLERVARSLLHEAGVRAIADNAAVRDAFAHGEADAAMTNTFEAPRWAAGLRDVDVIGPLSVDVTALWFRVGQEDLAERFDAWLLGEEARGRLGELRARMLGAGGGPPTATPVDALLAATAERLALMPLVAAAKRRVGAPVEDTAQEERVLAGAHAAVSVAAAHARRSMPRAGAVEAFFRAELEAAKEVQRRDATPADASFDLVRDLRPAIARISARMAFLVVRVEAAPPELVRDEARRDLAESGLTDAAVDRIAAGISGLASP
jgi:cyclohexadienyl dehydratase